MNIHTPNFHHLGYDKNGNHDNDTNHCIRYVHVFRDLSLINLTRFSYSSQEKQIFVIVIFKIVFRVSIILIIAIILHLLQTSYTISAPPINICIQQLSMLFFWMKCTNYTMHFQSYSICTKLNFEWKFINSIFSDFLYLFDYITKCIQLTLVISYIPRHQAKILK